MVTSKEQVWTALLFLHWHSTDALEREERKGEGGEENCAGAENGAEKAADEAAANPSPIAPDDTHQAAPRPVPTLAASSVPEHKSEPPQAKYWRENLRNTTPRPDGSLRHADRAVLGFLRANIALDDDTGENISASANDGLETCPLSHRAVGEGCGIASRTAQVALRRLTLQRLITSLAYTPGSREGRRYRSHPMHYGARATHLLCKTVVRRRLMIFSERPYRAKAAADSVRDCGKTSLRTPITPDTKSKFIAASCRPDARLLTSNVFAPTLTTQCRECSDSMRRQSV